MTDVHKLEQLAREASVSFEAGTQRVFLNGEDVTDEIRTPEVSAMASRVSRQSRVCAALWWTSSGSSLARVSVVMEGRDIGTVVFPDADVKIFLDAPPDVRAGRRTREFAERGEAVDGAAPRRR